MIKEWLMKGAKEAEEHTLHQHCPKQAHIWRLALGGG